MLRIVDGCHGEGLSRRALMLVSATVLRDQSVVEVARWSGLRTSRLDKPSSTDAPVYVATYQDAGSELGQVASRLRMASPSICWLWARPITRLAGAIRSAW